MDKKLIVKNTLFLYIRMIFVLAITLLTSRIVLNSLGVSDFGLFNVVGGVVALMSYIENTLSTSILRFITYELGKKDDAKIISVFSNALVIIVGFSILFFVLAETLGLWFLNNVIVVPENRRLACNIVYQAIIVSTSISVIKIPFNSLIIAQEKMGIYATISIVNSLIGLLIAYTTLYYLGDRLILYGVLIMTAAIFVTCTTVFYCKKASPLYCNPSFLYDGKLIKSILFFSSWNLLGSTATSFRSQGIDILINIFWGVTVNAANAIAAQINRAAIVFTSNFTNSLKPQITKTYASGDYQSLTRLIFIGGKVSFLLMVIVCYPVLFETPYLLNLWLGDYPDYTVVFTRLVIIISLIETFNQTIGCSIQATGRIKKYQIVVSSILLLNLPLSYFAFYLGLPVWSAYFICTIVSVIAVICRLAFVDYLLSISWVEYLKDVLIKSMLLSVLAAIIPWLVVSSFSEGIGRFFLMLTLSTISTILLSFYICFNRQDRSMVYSGALKLVQK